MPKKKPKTALEIVKEYLKKNGYDGLCNLNCGCTIDDLTPCCEDFSYCVPGYKVGCGECGRRKDCEYADYNNNNQHCVVRKK